MNGARPIQTGAAASFWGLGGIAIVLLSLAVLGIGLGFQSLLLSTGAARRAVECCGTIFSTCLISSSMLQATVPWVGSGVLLIGLLLGIRNAWRTWKANGRFLADLRPDNPKTNSALYSVGMKLGLIDHISLVNLPGRRQAFTAGLLAPHMYLTRELCSDLSKEELEAVLLHENHHRRCRDPLRVLIIRFLQDLLFFLPIGYFLTHAFLDAKEDAADDAVALGGGDSLELASVLCRVAQMDSVHSAPISASLPGIAGKGRVQRRIERLLFPGRNTFPRPKWSGVLISGVIVVLLLGSLYLPLLMNGSPFEFKGCSPSYCRGMECMSQ